MSKVMALTVLQPWAHVISLGLKKIENRKCYTNFRGTLLIHAGKSDRWCENKDWLAWPDMQLGKIVCVVRVIGCVKFQRFPYVFEGPEELRWVEEDEFTEGPYCWVLDDITPLTKPISARGKQGFWNFDVTGKHTELRKICDRHRKKDCAKKWY